MRLAYYSRFMFKYNEFVKIDLQMQNLGLKKFPFGHLVDSFNYGRNE